MGRTHQRKTQQPPKTKDIHRTNINHTPRSVSLGDQEYCTAESHRYSTTEVNTINQGGQNRATKEADANRKSLPNNGSTKKKSPNERKEERLRNNAKWKRGSERMKRD